ncbi:MAG: hypothetical protein KBC67_02820 [Candidatus Pacebacteria bacterium]|nr:hypothetical protein [Candidatus Paceibacterota bacterium]
MTNKQEQVIQKENIPEPAENAEQSPESELETVTEEMLGFESEFDEQLSSIPQAYQNISPEKLEEIAGKYKAEAEILNASFRETFADNIKKYLSEPVQRALAVFEGTIDGYFVEKAWRAKDAKENKKEIAFAETGSGFSKKLTDEEIIDISVTILNVHTLRKEDKKAKLDDIKETLGWYRHEIAQREAKLIDDIFKSPNADLADLTFMAHDAFSGIPMPFDAREQIDDILYRYYERNQKIQEMRNSHPDDRELFRELFNIEPIGRIEIMTTPISFYVRAHDILDYTHIHSRRWLDPEDKAISKDSIKRARQSGGVKLGNALQSELKGGILVENAGHHPFVGSARRTFQHEQQHALQHFFNERFDKVFADEKAQAESLAMERKEDLGPLLLRYFRERRTPIEEYARDEIFAFLVNDTSLNEIKKDLFDKKGLYSYYEDNKGYYNSTPELEARQDVAQAIKEGKPTFDEIVTDVTQKVYVEEYKKNVSEALECIKKLRDGGVPRNLIMRIFTHEPLAGWKKLTNRILMP